MLSFGAIEFKVRDNPNPAFSAEKWEDTAVHSTLVFGLGSTCENYDGMEEIANATAKALAIYTNTEVRWNWKSQLQGHYVAPEGFVNLSTSKIEEVTS